MLSQSLLIEGRGRYNCSKLAGVLPGSPDCLSCNATNPNCAPHVLPVTPGKTYRLRIASVASLSSLNFILEVRNLNISELNKKFLVFCEAVAASSSNHNQLMSLRQLKFMLIFLTIIHVHPHLVISTCVYTYVYCVGLSFCISKWLQNPRLSARLHHQSKYLKTYGRVATHNLSLMSRNLNVHIQNFNSVQWFHWDFDHIKSYFYCSDSATWSFVVDWVITEGLHTITTITLNLSLSPVTHTRLFTQFSCI